MSSSKPRWWFLITPRWLGWHAFAVLAAWGMLWLGDWQFHRAEGGNPLSWAYTFEWPVFTLFGVVFWAKTIVDEWKARGGAPTHAHGIRAALDGHGNELGLPAAAHTAAITDDFDAAEDPELAAYNAYLSRLSTGQQAGRFQGSGQPGTTQPTAG